MLLWQLRQQDLKAYPHLDPHITASEATSYATNSSTVAQHSFYPFIRYFKGWTRFAKRNIKGKVKSREIRYAARRDAYIFSYYRYILSERYENLLAKYDLINSILAYRKILSGSGKGGKCNIDFAFDVFQMIREIGDCAVITLDISSFFESLDHDRLKSLWCKLLGEDKLPSDHYQVFRAITRYAVVDKERLYERLGHYGVKRVSKTGIPINGYLTSFRNIPSHLCTGRQFREKIAGGNGSKSIIEINKKPFGIPQGAPISDLLANLYLFDFDVRVNNYINKLSGKYFRYSDDILIVVPGNCVEGLLVEKFVRSNIRDFGSKLQIKEEKSSVLKFVKNNDHQIFELIAGSQGKNGLEYLGFRYDGKKVYIRDNTLSNLYRKVTRSARRAANEIARRYPDKDVEKLKELFDYEKFIGRFGRVEDFEENSTDYKSWTFWTYARRATKHFGELGRPILRQLRKHRTIIRRRIHDELQRAVKRRETRRSARKPA